MAESTLSIAYPQLQSAVGYFAGWGRDSSTWSEDQASMVDDVIQTGYRQFLNPPPVGGRTHRWSFLKPTAVLLARTGVTGTLSVVPDRLGAQYILSATASIFTESMEGLRIIFDDTENAFRITDYISGTKVKVVGEDDIEFGTLVEGVIANVEVEQHLCKVTADAAIFESDMIAPDYLLFTASGNQYAIAQYISATEVYVYGDASAEGASFWFVRPNGVIGSLPGGNGFLTATEPIFGSYMQATGNPYSVHFTTYEETMTLIEYVSGTTVRVFGTPEQFQAVGNAFKIERDDGTAASIGADIDTTTIESTEEIFTTDMVGQYAVFPYTSGTTISPLQRYHSFEILEYLSTTMIRVSGDATQETSKAFQVVHAVGTTSGAFVYDGTTTTITATAAVFTSAIEAGMIFDFDNGGSYAIASIVSTTQVKVVGNAGGEAGKIGADTFKILGASSQAAGDTFALEGGGEDYPLPDDFGAIDGPLTFGPSEGYIPISIVGEADIRRLRSYDRGTGRPQYAAVRPLTSDGTTGQRFELMLYPEPDGAYTLSYRYTRLPKVLSATNPYPLGGMVHGETIKASCLAAAEDAFEDARGVKWEKFMERLAASIVHDIDANEPEYLGYCGDGSDAMDSRYSRRDLVDNSSVIVTVNNVSP